VAGYKTKSTGTKEVIRLKKKTWERNAVRLETKRKKGGGEWVWGTGQDNQYWPGDTHREAIKNNSVNSQEQDEGEHPGGIRHELKEHGTSRESYNWGTIGGIEAKARNPGPVNRHPRQEGDI